MIHACMMHISILIPDTRDYDAHICMMHLSMMHVFMMHVSMILDPDTCMYDAYIYVPRSLFLMHVYMMHISMMDLDPEACMYL